MKINPYLWDKSGPRDSFISKLERALAAKRERAKRAGRRRGPQLLRVVLPIAVAAAAGLIVWVCSAPSAGTEAAKASSAPFAADKTESTKSGGKADGAAPKSKASPANKPEAEDKSVADPPLGQPGLENPSPSTSAK